MLETSGTLGAPGTISCLGHEAVEGGEMLIASFTSLPLAPSSLLPAPSHFPVLYLPSQRPSPLDPPPFSPLLLQMQ